jgi:sugar-phosphatase
LKSPAGDPVIELTCRAVLLDLDGTLVDSVPHIQRLWRVWSEGKGIPFDSIQSIMHGRRAIETLRLAAPGLNAEKELEDLETQEIADMQDVRLYPGALSLMQSLRDAPHAIVTSGSQRVAGARIRYIELPQPRVLVSGDDVNQGKPAPDAYLLAAAQLGLEPAECVVIEDSPAGIQAGKAAGMRVVAVASTHAVEELAGSDLVALELADIDLSADATGIRIRLKLQNLPPPRRR